MTHNKTRKQVIMMMVLMFISTSQSQTTEKPDIAAEGVEKLIPDLLSVVDLQGLEKGIPTLKLSLSPSVKKDTKLDVSSTTRKTTIKSTVNPNRIIYYTTASTVKLAPSTTKNGFNFIKTENKPNHYSKTETENFNPSKAKVRPDVSVPPNQTLKTTQQPKTEENPRSPSNSETTKVVSPEVKVVPTSSSEPSGEPKKRTQILGRFDSNLYQLAKDGNLLTTALKNANPENLEILLAFTQKQKQ
eukprot:TRINITY_DN10629_c0_g1_i1.p1 TRINITY_DN10629_c0_g1~~TRINITY_DN10629_c0_g1_i1.p1  ORF type:complete len:244 (-),score=56.60 TRINITY_DN10629_c0_g1_i1:46-777(-)